MNREMKRLERGFTLIELLVVISVIAVLLAILLPALRKVKEQAMQIPCAANQRTISTAFHLYQEENGGWLVTGHAYNTPADMKVNATDSNPYDGNGRDWVACPIDENGIAMRASNEVTVKYEVNGIKAGTLWPYIESEDSYQCPADNRAEKYNFGFRSYSMVAGLCLPYGNYIPVEKLVEKMNDVKNPSGQYISVEEYDTDGEGRPRWNMGSWVIDIPGRKWYDSVAGWHTKGSTLAFADGHSEKIKWQDPRTIEWLQNGALKGGNAAGKVIDHESPNRNPDMDYMLQGFLSKR